jgi:hypothetical protein
MKIINSKKTHFMKKSDCGLHQVKYDTIENVHSLLNTILDNGNKKQLVTYKAAYKVPLPLERNND